MIKKGDSKINTIILRKIKAIVKIAMMEREIKYEISKIKETLKEYIKKEDYAAMTNLLEKTGKKLKILEDNNLFGDFLQEIVNLRLSKEPEFKKQILTLGKKYKVLGIVFKII